jgi:hypothetical protein
LRSLALVLLLSSGLDLLLQLLLEVAKLVQVDGGTPLVLLEFFTYALRFLLDGGHR